MGNQMINYSVYMLSNQMNKDEAPKAYAKAQVKQVMSFRQFVDHIAEHGGHKRGQVKGVPLRHVQLSGRTVVGRQEDPARRIG